MQLTDGIFIFFARQTGDAKPKSGGATAPQLQPRTATAKSLLVFVWHNFEKRVIDALH